MGRPFGLTEKKIGILAKYIKKGLPIKYACSYAEISEDSFQNYRSLAAEVTGDIVNKVKKKSKLTPKDKLLLRFSVSMDKARADYILHHVENLNFQSSKFSDNSKWLLSHIDRQAFGNVETVINQTMPKIIEFEDE